MQRAIKEIQEFKDLQDPGDMTDQRENKEKREMQASQGSLVKLALQEKVVRMVLRVKMEIRDHLEPVGHMVSLQAKIDSI